MSDVRTRLAAHPFLVGMTGEHVDLLAAEATIERWPAQTQLFFEHRPADRFFLLVEGLVSIEMLVPGRGTVVLETVQAGEALGWSWLFPPYTWHFGACTVEPTQAVVLDAARVRALGEREPAFGYQLMCRVAGVVIHRLQAARLRLMDVYGHVSER